MIQKKKLAIISTHPIQYNAPWFRLLAERGVIELRVFYTWSQAKETVIDHNFGQQIKWDVPLLEGYDYEFVENISKNPGTHHFFGINCPSLISSVKSFAPDAILIFGWNFVSHLKALRYFKGKVPVWFRGDSTLLDELPGIKTFLRRRFLTWVYSHVDKAFYVGTANKAYYLKHGLKSSQLIYAPHAIDNDRFAEPQHKYQQDALQWREQLGYIQEDLIVLFVGKFEPKKQPLLLLKAIKNVNERSPKVIKALFVGSGILELELKQMAERFDYIQFLPFQNQSQMPVVYRLGDIVCLPSRGPGETWGLAVNEAMASGKPVIITDKVGCAEDLVATKDFGFVFKYETPEALEEILVNLNKENLNQMGSNAQDYIFSWSFKAITEAIEKTVLSN